MGAPREGAGRAGLGFAAVRSQQGQDPQVTAMEQVMQSPVTPP
jgi:hypothetical protein